MNVQPSRLIQVVETWMPRISTAGISELDAQRVVAAAGDWSNWCKTWSAEAERHLAMAAEAERAGRLITAGEALTRAALFYHFGQFMFFDDLAQKRAADEAKYAIYRRAAPYLMPPAKLVEVPFKPAPLYGYLRRPGAGSWPVVINIPGSDSTKEEFSTLEDHFLRRGLATFSVDGPGQGQGRAAGFIDSSVWSAALRAIVDALARQDGLNGRVGIMGMAFGGHMLLHGAKAVPELAAVVVANGFYDMAPFFDAMPEIYRANMAYLFGVASVEEARERARKLTLKGLPKLACPLLVTHGARGKIYPAAEAKRVFELGGPGSELAVFPEGNHVCNNIAYKYRPLIADWLKEKLSGSARPH